eukprot:7316513-Prymnesium_polylepis.2
MGLIPALISQRLVSKTNIKEFYYDYRSKYRKTAYSLRCPWVYGIRVRSAIPPTCAACKVMPCVSRATGSQHADASCSAVRALLLDTCLDRTSNLKLDQLDVFMFIRTLCNLQGYTLTPSPPWLHN